MKKLFILSLTHVFISVYAFANGGLGPDKPDPSRGTAGVDEAYTDELNTRDSAIQRQNETRERMRENPRNQGMVESFGQIHSKEDDQDRQEEATEEPGGAEYDKKRVWR